MPSIVARFAWVLPFAALTLACFAQTQSAPPAPTPAAADPYRNEALIFERLETAYRMNTDGTGERDLHVRVRVQSDGAAQQFGVLSFPYASAYETPQIKFVRVYKADATMVDTPTADAIDMPAEVTREAPLYSDLKEKHLPVRSLSPGDTIEYEVDTKIDKPEAPGQFWGAEHFTAPGTLVVLAEVLTLDVPADKYVQVWSPNHTPAVTEQNGRKIYSWNATQLVTAPKRTADDAAAPAAPKDPDEDSDGRKLPSVAWTTFHSWAEVGDWYRSLSLTQSEPNGALRAKASEITASAKTPEDQVRAIYEYVSGKTRYVGIDFGIGRYQPHAAADVLADQYGDCKDKDTLLEALLRAKGFSTAPALIGAGIAPVPEVPLPAVFNHVITTVNLPGGRIWLDSTPTGAPYQYLSAVIRDQKALVVPASGPAGMAATPANAPYSFSAKFEAVGTLDAAGKLTAKMTAGYRDDDEVAIRAAARSIAPADWDKASQYLSSAMGFGGATSDTQFENAGDSTVPIVLTYDYVRHPYGDWDNKLIVPLFPAMEFTALDNDTSAPEGDIQLGAPRTLSAISRIRLPDGFRPDLPDPIHVKTDFATFDKIYRYEGNEIIAERDIVVLKNKVSKADWKKYQSFTKDISLNSEAWIRLMQVPKTANVPAAASVPKTTSEVMSKSDNSVVIKLHSEPPATNASTAQSVEVPLNATADDLMKLAMQRMTVRDWGGTKEMLDKAKEKNPNEENLWNGYGFIAEMEDHNFDQAKTDFRKELSLHPDNQMAVGSLADMQQRNGDPVGARQTVQQYLDHHPDNLRLSMYLVSLETKAADYDAALKTLQKVADQNPDNRALQLQISDMLIHLHRNDEAVAAAKSVLGGTDDPELLNDAAYMLSKAGTDLALAEDASRRSIAKLEEESAAITTEQANSSAFARANMLTASWDTLGWLLFKEGKFDQAKPLLEAAWLASLQAETGDHLGQLDEAMGRKDEAVTAYGYAQTACNRNTPQDVHAHITESVQRLKAIGAKPRSETGAQGLQDLRTYKFARPAGASGWGTFRLEITTAGVIESQQMSGGQQIASIKPALDKLKFPQLLPPDSKAHLLRSAVASCSLGTMCELVLVPDGGLQTEQ
jgi:tetratricopeptide (TPR) repeat protein/transglutaminase-like putative cysteine protease